MLLKPAVVMAGIVIMELPILLHQSPGRILVIRTASGKYAKIEIQNYYKGGVTPDATASDNDKLMKQRIILSAILSSLTELRSSKM
jgi:hypothetical protein